jgi:hypothetical protein
MVGLGQLKVVFDGLVPENSEESGVYGRVEHLIEVLLV